MSNYPPVKWVVVQNAPAGGVSKVFGPFETGPELNAFVRHLMQFIPQDHIEQHKLTIPEGWSSS